MIRSALSAALLLTGCSMAPPAREEVLRGSVVANWPTIPAYSKFGQVSAVDVDAQGRVYVLHRAGREWSEAFPAEPIAEPTVFVFDGESGAFLSQWGAGQFIMPHGLSVDAEGKVWITDVGREQVFRFDAEGREELVIGERGVGGDDARHFGRPTDIAFAGDEVFVSDGYLNQRVAVFDREGRFLRQWGEAGNGDQGLNIPHAIAIALGKAYVVDREHGRIQVSDLQGRVSGNWSGPTRGHPYSVKVLPDGRIASIEGRDAADRSGAIVRIWRADGTIERSIDIGLPGLQASLGHDLAFGPDGMAYAADVYGNRIVKLDLGARKTN